MRTGTHKRTLHVDERGRVGHGEGLVGGRQGLALMAAGHHHLHGQHLEVVLRMLLLLQRRAELRGGVLRPLPLERQHAMELLHRTPARETPHAVANCPIPRGRRLGTRAAYLGRREDDGRGGGDGEEGQVPHHP